MNKEKICPVCGKHEFEDINAFEECPVCGWVDDLIQRNDPDYEGGFNRMSLNQAKEAYEKKTKIA